MRFARAFAGPAAILVLVMTGDARAIQVTIGAVKDNTLYQSATGALSNGVGEHFFAGRTGQLADYIRRGLVQFDIAGNIPAGATIQSVQLTLNMSKTPLGAGARTISLHKVSAAWGEGASNDIGQEGSGTASAPGDATWIHTSYNTEFWSAAGGDFAVASSASLSVNALGFYTWGSTAAMVADVQAWYDSPGTNFGWLLRGEEGTSATAKRFDTRENLIAANRPKLIIQYTLPPQPPALDPIGPQQANEGQLLSFTVSASDPNGTIPDLAAENLPAGANFADNNDGTGDFSFTPGFDQANIYNVRFIASDVDSADTELVTVTIIEVTDYPVASDAIRNTPEEQPLVDQLVATDPDTDPLTYAIVSGPFNGGISGFNPNTGDYTYTPALNYNGPDSLKFEANDGNATSAPGTVRLTVTPVNDPPAAGDVNMPVVINVPSGSGTMPVTDVDNVSWTVSQLSGPFNGNVSNFDPQTGSFTYTPDTDYEGLDSIKYQANDGQAPSNVGTVRINVVNGCSCPFQSDFDEDGFLTALDLGAMIDILFAGNPDVQDGTCPVPRADFDCDGFSTALDLGGLIDHLFAGQPGPCDPCAL